MSLPIEEPSDIDDADAPLRTLSFHDLPLGDASPPSFETPRAGTPAYSANAMAWPSAEPAAPNNREGFLSAEETVSGSGSSSPAAAAAADAMALAAGGDWAPEWGGSDGPDAAADAADPFFLDWPAW